MRFKEFVLEEGDMIDALKHGFKTGIKAFQDKRKEQEKKTQKQKMTDAILTAEGGDLRRLIKKIVDDGYTVSNGKVKDPSRVKHMNKEVLECIRTRKAFI